jgi:uncharacterized protein YbaP (TraB family)
MIFLIIGALLVIGSVTFASINEFNYEPKKIADKDGFVEFKYNPPIYKVCNEDDSCSYIVGFTKLGDDRVQELDNKLDEVIDDSTVFAFQYDDTNIDEEKYLTNFTLDSNETLDDIVSPELKEKLIKFSNDSDLYDYEKYKNYSLGFNYKIIESILYNDASLNKDGVQIYLINKYSNNEREVLEDKDYDIEFISYYTDSLYEKLITNLLDNYSDKKKTILDNYNNYLDGNDEELNKYYSIELTEDNSELNNYLTNKIIKKNEKYASYIRDSINSRKSRVVVLDIENIYGNDGVLTLLNDLTITKIK